jgi:hypothetical protein
MKKAHKRILGLLIALLVVSSAALLAALDIRSAAKSPVWILESLKLAQIAGVLILTAIVAGVIWKVPRWQVEQLAQSGVGPKDVAELENAARATLAQIVGGAFFLATLYFTWQTLQVDRQKEITDGFTRAVDQLGSKDRNVRVGGIYALEQVARTSPQIYEWTVTEILAAFVRERAPLKSEPALISPCDQIKPQAVPVIRPEVDVQAALEVIGRRTMTYGPRSRLPYGLDLTRTDLRGANLSTSDLGGAVFTDSNLQAAFFTEAHMEQAILQGAHLECAFMPGAILEKADLRGAHLEGAILGPAKGEDFPDAIGLTCSQLKFALLNEKTALPSYLPQRDCSANEQIPIDAVA